MILLKTKSNFDQSSREIESKNSPNLIRKNEKGFTIIELMVATAVFSIVLLLCINAFIQIGRMYYKGITSSKTQSVAQTVNDEISRAIQFSNDKIAVYDNHSGTLVPSANPGSSEGIANGRICIGILRYDFSVGKQLSEASTLTTNQTKTALQRDEVGPAAVGGCTGTHSTSVEKKPVELLDLNMRLNELTVKPVGAGDDLWLVKTSVAYGESDLFEKKTDGSVNYRLCAGGSVAGQQFCSVSELETVVRRRIND